MKKSKNTCIGSIGKPRGLKGEFFLNSYCSPEKNIINYKENIRLEDNSRIKFKYIKTNNSKFIAKIDGINNIDLAKEYTKKKNIRVLRVDLDQDNPYPGTIKKVSGGILIQDDDTKKLDANELRCVTERKPSDDELDDLLFAWKVAKFVKSNAIVYVKNKQTIGIGAGQMSRVISAEIANLKAKEEGLEVKNAVMASDAFFPFRDGIDKAASSGIAAIIQPGGSIKDDEVIAAANEHNIAMMFTGMRHFRH